MDLQCGIVVSAEEGINLGQTDIEVVDSFWVLCGPDGWSDLVEESEEVHGCSDRVTYMKNQVMLEISGRRWRQR